MRNLTQGGDNMATCGFESRGDDLSVEIGS
jgi:hypothetical protein